MGTVQKLAETVKEGIQTALPKLRKTVINKLALAVGPDPTLVSSAAI